jgi:DNA-binding transcriptional regulator YhcF (GntR family)
MTKPTVAEHNAETNETVYREMTDEEYAEHLKMAEQYEKDIAARKLELENAAALKAAALAKLTALGLTEEEAKAIAG